MAAKAVVRGDKEIIANLRNASKAVGGSFLDKTLREALEPMRLATIVGALQRRQWGYNPPGGHLDQGVVVQRVASNGALNKEYWLSFRKRARKIAHLVEFGTAPHWQPRRKIMHPGARPYPFFRPAFEETKHEVTDEIGQRVWNRIQGSIVGAFATGAPRQ